MLAVSAAVAALLLFAPSCSSATTKVAGATAIATGPGSEGSGVAGAPATAREGHPKSGRNAGASGLVFDQGPVARLPAAQVEAGVPHLRFNVALGDSAWRGPPDAPVTIVMFSDFECPYCGRGMQIVEMLEREYADQIRFVYKAFPMTAHRNALRAALMAQSAWAQDKFWPFHNLLLSQAGLDPAKLAAYAETAGLDMVRTETELEQLVFAPAVRRDIRQAKRLAIRSTPTFYINGRHVKGAQRVAIFRAIVDQEISLAKKWKLKGGPDLDVYRYATQHGYVQVRPMVEHRGLQPDRVYPVPLGASPSLGPQTALLTVVVFGDFQCPFCARANDLLHALRNQYSGQLRIVYKHVALPGHDLAFAAARASMAAHEQGEFWSFHDALYAKGARFDERDLERIAVELGLDLSAFPHGQRTGRYDAHIHEDIELGERLGVTGTPTFFVNGRPLEGAQPQLEFRMLFVEELERARSHLARGVAPRDLYASLTSG